MRGGKVGVGDWHISDEGGRQKHSEGGRGGQYGCTSSYAHTHWLAKRSPESLLLLWGTLSFPSHLGLRTPGAVAPLMDPPALLERVSMLWSPSCNEARRELMYSRTLSRWGRVRPFAGCGVPGGTRPMVTGPAPPSRWVPAGVTHTPSAKCLLLIAPNPK